MLAAARFFRGQGSGEQLPYLAEYLLSLDGHGSWQALQAMPVRVLQTWLLYRQMRLRAQEERG